MRTSSFRACWSVVLFAAGVGHAGQVNYGRPFEPPTRPAFIPLPPGAVEPEGWLRDWCLAARDGYTGHMDEYHVEFQRAWAVDHTMTGDRLAWPRGAWPYEGGGYWFDGLVRLGYVLHDDALVQQAAELAPHFERTLHGLQGANHVLDIRNCGLAGAIQLAPRGTDPIIRPFEAGMALWKAGFYVRFGGDTLQFGPTFNARPEDLDRLFDAVGSVLSTLD